MLIPTRYKRDKQKSLRGVFNSREKKYRNKGELIFYAWLRKVIDEKLKIIEPMRRTEWSKWGEDQIMVNIMCVI